MHPPPPKQHRPLPTYKSCLAILLLPLIRSPYTYNTNGTGINATVKNPNRLLAHPTPRRAYMAFANSGNAAPNDDRTRSLPAYTEATYFGYASPRYVSTDMKSKNAPTLKKALPMMGMIQCTAARADHPN